MAKPKSKKAKQVTDEGNVLEPVGGSVMDREIEGEKPAPAEESKLVAAPAAETVKLPPDDNLKKTTQPLEPEIAQQLREKLGITKGLPEDKIEELADSFEELVDGFGEFVHDILEAVVTPLKAIERQLRIQNAITLKDEIQNKSPEQQKGILDRYAGFGCCDACEK